MPKTLNLVEFRDKEDQDSYRGLQISLAFLLPEPCLHYRKAATFSTRFASQRCHTVDPIFEGLKVDVVPPPPAAETLQYPVCISPTRMGNVRTN